MAVCTADLAKSGTSHKLFQCYSSLPEVAIVPVYTITLQGHCNESIISSQMKKKKKFFSRFFITVLKTATFP
jgi:hypothetical protein